MIKPARIYFLLMLISIRYCVIVPHPENCDNITFYNICLKCSQGYQLNQQSNICLKINQDSTTILALPSGVEIDRVNPVDINCKVKLSQYVCKECYYSFYYDANTKLCAPVSPLCKEWNAQGECLSCYKGYKVDQGKCILDEKKVDPNCFELSGDVCVKCAFRYYLNSDGYCSVVNPNCKTWNSKSGDCLSCFDGFGLNKGDCLAFSQTDINAQVLYTTKSLSDNCAQYNQKGQCIKCSLRFYYNSTNCAAVSDLCKTWDDLTGECLTCYDGYQIFGKQCLKQIPFCEIRSNQGCVQCMNGYFINQTLGCAPVSPLCKSYDVFTGLCTKCYQNYNLVDGKCTQ